MALTHTGFKKIIIQTHRPLEAIFEHTPRCVLPLSKERYRPLLHANLSGVGSLLPPDHALGVFRSPVC